LININKKFCRVDSIFCPPLRFVRQKNDANPTKHSTINFYAKYLILCIPLLLNGCSLAYKSTGDIMLSYAEDQGVPYMLATDDVALGCTMSEAFTPFLLSFSKVTASPDHLAILFYLMAGNCSEFKAWEEELRYLRATYAKNILEAQDARIAQQRLQHQAAHRQLTGYHYLTLAITEPGEQCPDFDSDNEEFYWLIGLMNGIQAIMNDIASGGSTAVPMDIAARVGRGAVCLDNEKWWGVPDAIHAAIQATMPGNQQGGKEPLQKMELSIQNGLQQGMHMSQVLAAQVYLGLGDTVQVKKIIREFGKSKTQSIENEAYKILNKISILQIQAISDRLWTQATGKRTPMGKLGSFWDDPKKPVETIDIDAIL